MLGSKCKRLFELGVHIDAEFECTSRCLHHSFHVGDTVKQRAGSKRKVQHLCNVFIGKPKQ